MPTSNLVDMSVHERRRAQRMADPEFRAAYERAAREIEQTDQIIRALDELRDDLGISKAELARRINRNASSIRRLFTASSARPELPLIAAIADALGAEVRVVRKGNASKRRASRGPHARSGERRKPVAA
jgi:ribosome-binding protein aMBF1 (putative translation factor)